MKCAGFLSPQIVELFLSLQISDIVFMTSGDGLEDLALAQKIKMVEAASIFEKSHI